MTKSFKRFLAMSMLSVLFAACTSGRPDLPAEGEGTFAACPESPNCVSSQATDERHHIAPLAFKGDPQESFDKLKKLLAGRKDTKIITESPTRIVAEFHTLLFVDDGLFLLAPEGQAIQVRSASRIGYWDLGKNRERIEEIRRDFFGVQAGKVP